MEAGYNEIKWSASSSDYFLYLHFFSIFDSGGDREVRSIRCYCPSRNRKQPEHTWAHVIPECLKTDSESFLTTDSEFWVKNKISTIFLRDIRGFLFNSAFFAVFTILNRKKPDFVNPTFKNENIDPNNDLEKIKSEKSWKLDF